jgi:hypothetical protein
MIVTLCGAGALMVGGLTLTARAAEKSETKTVEGELVDLHCYSAGDAKGADHAKCGAGCAKSGIPVAVLVDGKAWTLATNPRPLSDAVGKQVRVTGSTNDATQTFLADKVEVKDGDAWKEVKLNDVHHKGGKEEEKKS